MNSNLGCIGIDVDEDGLHRLLAELTPVATVVGMVDGDTIHAWQDLSGARLIFSVRDGVPIDILPCFEAKTDWLMQGCRMVNATVATAGVFDADGEQLTALTFAPEQHRFLRTRRRGADVVTRLVGLGFDVEVFADPAAFGRDRASLLSSDGPPDGARLGAGSFLSYGVWEGPDDADAYARIGGLVRHAEPRRNQATGQAFSLVRVSVLDLELDLCLPAEIAVPSRGQVVAGLIYLVGAMAGVPYGSSRAGGHRASL